MRIKEANMEKEETKNLLGFWAMEFVPNLIFIGALSMNFCIGLGSFFRLASLEIVESLGVILKMALVATNVVMITKINKPRMAPTMINGCKCGDTVGMAYVFLMTALMNMLSPKPKGAPTKPETSPIRMVNAKNNLTISELSIPIDMKTPI